MEREKKLSALLSECRTKCNIKIANKFFENMTRINYFQKRVRNIILYQ